MKRHKTDAALYVAVLFKFLIFNVMWALPTTFSTFSHLTFWLSNLLVALVCSLPFLLGRWRKLQTLVLLLLDTLFIINLMYFRTYYTSIPLSSYALSGNLADFLPSVYDSFRWYDIVHPLGTLLIYRFLLRRKGQKSADAPKRKVLVALILLVVALSGKLMIEGGFKESYNNIRQKAYLCSGTTAIYTIFGDLAFDLISGQETLTPEARSEIEGWLASRPAYTPLSDSIPRRRHCIVILAESLESWVIGATVEGQEITPALNRLIADSTTLYAPKVLTQVKGGRSIDCQLMLCAGLLPINSGTYSALYPDNHYATIPKALKEKYNSRNYLMTIDKVSTWNQGMVARSFGIDTIVAYHDFKLTEAFGTHKRTGDRSFFEQCKEKMEKGEIWREGESVYMQFVTYSGHAPFKLPEELKQVRFSDRVPTKMNDYMTTANYTDRAIGEFVAYLKSRPEYQDMLIVVTGDHEGLASWREEIRANPLASEIVSPGQFTPFIVINSPIGMTYEGVMGQIDMYPTILNLMGLDDYEWKGMGQSILDPNHPGTAVSPQMEVVGNTSVDASRHTKAYDVSDLIIRFDYPLGKR